MDRDGRTRAAIEEHRRASERGDAETEEASYAAEAILDYPQSGERFRGRATITAQRGGHPAARHFTIQRITGGGDRWVSGCMITYDGVPTAIRAPVKRPRIRWTSGTGSRGAAQVPQATCSASTPYRIATMARSTSSCSSGPTDDPQAAAQ
jgi:hypothetical protein